MRRLLIGLIALDVIVIALGNVLGAPTRWPDIEVPVIGSLFASLSGEPLVHIAGEAAQPTGGIGISNEISISNSLFTMWLVMGFLIGISFVATRNLRLLPGRLQNVVELVVQGLSDFVQSTGGPQALRYFPLFGTLFLFILMSNWLSVVPFVSQIRGHAQPAVQDQHQLVRRDPLHPSGQLNRAGLRQGGGERERHCEPRREGR